MGIPLKGSRPLDVDGVMYRFLVRKERLLLGVRVITVQKVGGDGKPGGQLLQAKLKTKLRVGLDEQEKPDDDVVVTPEDVRMVVRNAIERGWDASCKGVFTDVDVSNENWCSHT